jgi:GNAT superfamily N-acetyltransferase
VDPRPYEILTPFERFLHGGAWMDLGSCRRHLHEYASRGFPVLVAEEGGRVVGHCDVWLAEEPEPFGRYGEAEMLLVDPARGGPGAMGRLLEHAMARCRRLGLPAFDLSPKHGGGGELAEAMGFAPIWDTRTLEAPLAAVPSPDEDFETADMPPAYEAVADLLCLNHREPAAYRHATFLGSFPSWRLAGVPREHVLAKRLRFKGGGGAVVAARREWIDPNRTELDLWVPPPWRRDADALGRILAMAAETARRLGGRVLTTYLPAEMVEAARPLAFEGGEEPDPWLRKALV